jgi:hypothetical protein
VNTTLNPLFAKTANFHNKRRKIESGAEPGAKLGTGNHVHTHLQVSAIDAISIPGRMN